MTVVSFSAHSRANCPACPCAIPLIVMAREAPRASAGSTRRSRNLAQAKVLTVIDLSPASISIAGSYNVVDGGDDVECEPAARHDDEPSRVVRQISVWPDFRLIDFADVMAILD